MTNQLHLRFACALTLSLPFLACAARADQWTTPTPAELSMTSIPEVPNAPAVYLYKEQTTDDFEHAHRYYVRLKVLTERGKDYANVELPYITGQAGYNIDEIAGRTIHPDGSIVMFTGKPYDKLVSKAGRYQEKAKVFTLPAVDVGSIIEYRYKFSFDEDYFWSPDWYLQSDLYTRQAHYMWRPTNKQLVNDKGDVVSGRVAWAPILPQGAAVKQETPAGKFELTLDVHDIPPFPEEEDMPPLGSVSYRVLFYYSAYANPAEFWKSEGKTWSKAQDKFIGPNSAVNDFVRTLVLPADTQQQKADKLYTALMTFENTDFTRARSSKEDKAAGLKEVSNAGDVIRRKRGTSDQIAETYVAMARAAGLKAYVMAVANRDERLFVAMYLSLRQLDDDIAIINIDGKDVFFDPGQRFCEPGHLAWKHTVAGGIRQVDGGTRIASTMSENYRYSHISRIADLTLDDHGEATGTVTLTYTGDPALRWRQQALRGDDTSLNADLRESMERILPGGMEVRVTDVQALADYNKPLKITYSIKGAVGASTGKRLMVPADIFEANEKPRFPQDKRELVVDLHYSSQLQDAVRFHLPASLVIESTPVPDKLGLQQVALFNVSSRTGPSWITSYRDVTLGSPLFAATEYPGLKNFYAKLESKDQEPIILTRAPVAASAAPAKPGGN